MSSVFFFQAEDGIRDADVTGVQTCALPIWLTLVDCTLEEARPLGVVGAWVSELGSVVQIAWALLNETLPAASRANTDRRYSVLALRPVRFFVTMVPGASASLLPSW